jgi:hypothetical protein
MHPSSRVAYYVLSLLLSTGFRSSCFILGCIADVERQPYGRMEHRSILNAVEGLDTTYGEAKNRSL